VTHLDRLTFPARAFWLALVSPRGFAELARAHAVESGSAFGDLDRYMEGEEERIRWMRRLWLRAIAVTGSALIAGAVIGNLVLRFVGPFTGPWRLGLQYVGLGFVLLSVVGRAGWQFQTWDGTSLHEKVNEWGYLFLNFAGALLLSASVDWPATGRLTASSPSPAARVATQPAEPSSAALRRKPLADWRERSRGSSEGAPLEYALACLPHCPTVAVRGCPLYLGQAQDEPASCSQAR